MAASLADIDAARDLALARVRLEIATGHSGQERSSHS